MLVQRKLMSGNKEVEELFDNASLYNFNLIELVWSKPGDSIKHQFGWKIPVINERKGRNFNVNIDTSIRFVEGSLNFYPDRRGLRYAYVVDIPENRTIIFNSFASGQFNITDQNLRDELLREAKKQGIDTEVIKKPTVNVKYTPREKKALSEAAEMKKRIAELEAALIQAEDEGKAKIERPLSRVKIDKEKRDEITDSKKDTE